MTKKDLEKERDDAAKKGIESLARYKFMMFGYWAAMWVHFNRLGDWRPNPFRFLVEAAREKLKEKNDDEN